MNGSKPLERSESEMISHMTGSIDRDVTRRHEGLVASAGSWLSLAAAPTFAVMALLTCVMGGGPMDALCSIAGASPLSGMVPMYLLMSAFHLAPWLKLIARRRNGARRS